MLLNGKSEKHTVVDIGTVGERPVEQAIMRDVDGLPGRVVEPGRFEGVVRLHGLEGGALPARRGSRGRLASACLCLQGRANGPVAGAHRVGPTPETRPSGLLPNETWNPEPCQEAIIIDRTCTS